jgi:ABC-type transport system involved in multi-copper enzyme maturation permease subunit
MRILTIALNTYREAVRDRILYVLLFFAGATIVASKALGYISLGEDVKIIADISLAAISIFGALIAIFVGTNLVYKEIDKRTIYTILSQPIWRYEFVLGKYLGLAMLIGTVTLAMGAGAAVYIAVLGGTVNIGYCEAVLLIYCKLLLVTGLSVLLSTITSPILGAIIVLTAYFFGHATGIMVDLPGHFDGTRAKALIEAAYYVVPNLSNFDIWREYANGVGVPHAYVVWTVGYGAAFTAILLYLAAMAFREKDV